MYKKYNNKDRTLGSMGTWECGRNPWCDREEAERSSRCDCVQSERGRKHDCEENEYENNIYINTNIQIDQEANANGGSGGNGGEAEGGDAANATGGLLNIAVNEIELDAEIGIPTLDELNQMDSVKALQEPNGEAGTTVTGGNAAADGGNGGNATSTNIAEVTVENIIIIAANSDSPTPAIHLGSNGNHMDIKIDKEGNAFVNGQKLDAQELDNGSKVLIFRENHVKNEENKK